MLWFGGFGVFFVFVCVWVLLLCVGGVVRFGIAMGALRRFGIAMGAYPTIWYGYGRHEDDVVRL